MPDITMPERTAMWALRIGCVGPATLAQIHKATENTISKDTVEKALAGLVELHLVEKLIVPGTKHGPGRTLYGLTLRGYDWREDENA